jgi:hypothetical protein
MLPKFVLQFDPSEISRLAARYGPEQDEEAFRAGSRIAAGNCTRENLNVIVCWKSPRRAALIDDNTDAELAKALRFAADIRTSEKPAVEILDGLRGVGVPVASAILTTIHPTKYTVIDFRALESLGVSKWDGSVNYYLNYLRACSALAVKHKVTLRTLDRALWQWSKENGARNQSCA